MSGPAPQLWTDENGRVMTVDPAEAEVAAQAGWKPATSADVDAFTAKKRAGSASGKAAAFAEGFASGTVDAATAIPRAVSALGAHVAGAADPLADMTGRGALETAAGALGGDQFASAKYAQDARLRAEENPITAAAGSIGGQVLGSELGGLGALARGAGGAATKAIGAGRAARIAGAGVTGAVEGAPLSLVAAQDQAYIEQRKLTGEMAIGAMGMGALIGGGIGAGARGVGEAIGAGKNAIVNRLAKPATGEDAVKVAEQQFGEAAPGLRDAYANASGAVSGKDPEVIRSLTAGGKAGKEARQIAVYEGDAIREASKRAIREHVDDMASATKNLTEEWRGPVKASNVEKVIAKGEEAHVNQFNQVVDQLHGVRSKLTEMVEDPAAYGEVKKLRDLDRFAQVAERDAAKAAEAGDHVGMYTALDGLKRRIGSLASGGTALAGAADKATSLEIRGLYDGLKTSLEDEAVWGGAAKMQREVNEPFTRWLKSKNLFDRRFMTETGDVAANPWERTYGADPSKINGYVEGLTSAKNDLDHQLIRKHIENTKALAASLSKAGELTPEKAAELSKVVKAAEGFEGTVGKAEKSLVLSNQLRELEHMEHGGAGSFAGAAGGAMVGGPVGAAIGAVGGLLNQPGKMVRRMAMIERMADKAGVSIDSSLNKVFAGIEKAGSKIRVGAQAVKDAVTPTALELFQGNHATPELAYKARAREVLDADANYGQRIRDNAAHVFGSTFDADPHAVGAAVVATTKAVRLLADKMPGGLVQPQSLTPMSTKTAPSRLDIQQYAMLHTAVTQPLAVIADIHKGTVTHDQIEAIAEVHPALIQHVRMSVLERLQKLDRDGVEVPLRQRIILDSLLDLDGAGEPVLSSDFAEKYAAPMSDTAAALAEAHAPKPRPGPSKIGDRLKTPTDEMIGGSQ